MSSDDDRKDPTEAPLDPFLGSEESEEGWEDAVDEWDEALDLPDDPPFNSEVELEVMPAPESQAPIILATGGTSERSKKDISTAELAEVPEATHMPPQEALTAAAESPGLDDLAAQDDHMVDVDMDADDEEDVLGDDPEYMSDHEFHRYVDSGSIEVLEVPLGEDAELVAEPVQEESREAEMMIKDLEPPPPAITLDAEVPETVLEMIPEEHAQTGEEEAPLESDLPWTDEEEEAAVITSVPPSEEEEESVIIEAAPAEEETEEAEEEESVIIEAAPAEEETEEAEEEESVIIEAAPAEEETEEAEEEESVIIEAAPAEEETETTVEMVAEEPTQEEAGALGDALHEADLLDDQLDLDAILGKTIDADEHEEQLTEAMDEAGEIPIPHAPAGADASDLFGMMLPPDPEAADAAQAGAVRDQDQWQIPTELGEEESEELFLEPIDLPDSLTRVDPDTLEVPQYDDPLPLDRSQWEELSERLQSESLQAANEDQAAALLFSSAYALQSIGETEQAIQGFRDVLQLCNGHLPALQSLRALLSQQGEMDAVAEVLKDLAAAAPDHEQALTRARATFLWALGADDASLRDLLKEPQEGDILGLLTRADVASAGVDVQELKASLDTLMEAVNDDEVAASLSLKCGRLLEEAGDFDTAKEAYSAALAVDPRLTGPIEGLLRLHHATDDHQALADLLSSSTAIDGPLGARRLRRSASLTMHHNLDGIEPLAQLQLADELSPEDPLILTDLAKVLQSQGEISETVETLTRLARVQPGPEQQAAALVEAALLCEEHLGDQQKTLDLFKEAATAMPQYAPAAEGIARLRLKDPDPFFRIEAHRSAAQANPPREAVVHHLAAAKILQKELEEPEAAAAELAICLEKDPTCRLALLELEGLYRESGDLESLAELLNTAASSTESATEAAAFRERAAHLYEGKLDKPELALKQWQRIMADNPDMPAPRQNILRCLATLDRQEDLLEELHNEAESEPDDLTAARLWSRRGDILHSLDRHQTAEESYSAALDRMPDYWQATWQRVANYAWLGHWGEVASQWHLLMETIPGDSPQHKALIMRLAALQEHELNDPHEAAGLYEKASWEPNPTPGAVEGLIRVLRKTGQNDRLAQQFQQQAEEQDDPGTRFAMLIAAGELLQSAAANWEKVAEYFQEAVQAMPENTLGHTLLEEFYYSREAWEPLAERLLQSLEGAGSPKQRAKIMERLADLDRIKGDRQNARRSYESIAGIMPDNMFIARRLQRMYITEESWSGLPAALQQEAENCSSDKDASALWLELGRLLSRQSIGADTVDPGSAGEEAAFTARDAYLASYERDNTSTLALRFLVDNAWSMDDEERLAQHYLEMANLVGEGIEAAIYYTRAGELNRDIELYNRALELAPDYLGATNRLRDAAIQMEDWETAIQAAEAEGNSSKVKKHIAAAFLLAGEIARLKLDDSERALAFYQTVMDNDPSSSVGFNQLKLLLEQGGRWEELVTLLSERAEVEQSNAKLEALHQTLAYVTLSKTNNSELAKRHLRALLKFQPHNKESLSSLAELYYADQQWEEASRALLGLARMEKDREKLKDVFLKLGLIYREKIPDAKRAIASYGKVLSFQPTNLLALQQLSDLFMKEKRYKDALKVSTQLYQQDGIPENKVRHMLRIARIYEEGLDDSHRATMAFRQAQEMAPKDLDVMQQLCEFFIRQNDQRSLTVMVDRSIASMRSKLKEDAFDDHSYEALFRLFKLRQTRDGALCAAQALASIGAAGVDHQEFVDKWIGNVGKPVSVFGDRQVDEVLFKRSIPGGFRQVFQLLGDSFSKIIRGNLKAHDLGRSDRLTSAKHPVRQIGDMLARDMGVSRYEIYICKSKPRILMVENMDPPVIVIGEKLLEGAQKVEITFLLGRSMWLIRKSLVLPARLVADPERLELLVAGIVRQYRSDFHPPKLTKAKLSEITKQVKGAIPRKLKQELMPFALECSGPTVKVRSLGLETIHSANRAGLLACRSIRGAISGLAKMYSQQIPEHDSKAIVDALRGNPEVEELLRFAISDAHLDLRRTLRIAID